jgi:hypothetical protein
LVQRHIQFFGYSGTTWFDFAGSSNYARLAEVVANCPTHGIFRGYESYRNFIAFFIFLAPWAAWAVAQNIPANSRV